MVGSIQEITDRIPTAFGSYALCLSLGMGQQLIIGRLGESFFRSGINIYTGSAWGPGGLRGRMKHHMQVTSKPHWHIDWLRKVAKLRNAWYTTAPVRLECAWSKALAALPEADITMPGFGSSDCQNGCRAHLITFPLSYSMERIQSCLQSVCAGGELSKIDKIE